MDMSNCLYDTAGHVIVSCARMGQVLVPQRSATHGATGNPRACLGKTGLRCF